MSFFVVVQRAMEVEFHNVVYAAVYDRKKL
jgi:hypothetical protein